MREVEQDGFITRDEDLKRGDKIMTDCAWARPMADKALYLKSFEKMLEHRGYREGLPNTPDEVFEAWLSESWYLGSASKEPGEGIQLLYGIED